MMIDYLLILLASMLLAYIVVVITDGFQSEPRIDESLQRDITQQTTLLVTSAISRASGALMMRLFVVSPAARCASFPSDAIPCFTDIVTLSFFAVAL